MIGDGKGSVQLFKTLRGRARDSRFAVGEFPFVAVQKAAGELFIEDGDGRISAGVVGRERRVINFLLPICDMFHAGIEAVPVVDVSAPEDGFSVAQCK